MWDAYGKPIPEESVEDDFVSLHRRNRQRASDTFEEDLAELRRKRRDLQDRLFDMVDIGAEIERAKQTLEDANFAFQKHATKFDNKDQPDEEPANLIARLEKNRKQQLAREQDVDKKTAPLIKWSKYAEMKNDMPKLIGDKTKPRITVDSPNSADDVGSATIAPEIVANREKPTEKRRKKRSILKRKKSVVI